MRTHARWLAPLFAASLFLAACGDDDSDTSTDTTSDAGVTVAPDDSTDTTAGGSSDTSTDDIVVAEPGVVQVAEVGDLGEILVDADGMTLYTYGNDTAGEPSTCVDACTEGWPPYLADAPTAGEGVTAEIGTVENADGTVQVTVNGLPTYTFAGDAAAGEANGQGVADVWYVVDATGAVVDPDDEMTDTETTDTTAAAADTTETTDDGY